MADQASATPAEHTADILAQAAAEAAAPGADTENAYECPFCVMMRKGGCEDPFKAFMACGEKADKGEIEMTECLKEFEALNKCMASNQEVFDGLLTEMRQEEERVKQQEAAQQQQPAPSTSTAGEASAVAPGHHQAATVVTQHQQDQQQHQQKEGVQVSPQPASSSQAAVASSGLGQSSSSSSSRGEAGAVPAAL